MKSSAAPPALEGRSLQPVGTAARSASSGWAKSLTTTYLSSDGGRSDWTLIAIRQSVVSSTTCTW